MQHARPGTPTCQAGPVRLPGGLDNPGGFNE